MDQLILQSRYLPAVRLSRIYPKRTAGLVLVVLLAATAAGLLIALGLWSEPAIWSLTKIFAGLLLINLVYYLFLDHLTEDKVSVAGQSTRELLNFASTMALYDSVAEGKLFSYRFFRSLLRTTEFKWILRRLNIDPVIFKESLNKYPQNYSLELSGIVQAAADLVKREGQQLIRIDHLLRAILASDEIFSGVMFEHDVKDKELMQVGSWYNRHKQRRRLAYRFWDPERLLQVTGIGKNWSSGYTPNLDRVGYDVSRSVEINKPAHIYGHNKYIEQAQRYLVDGSHNVVLVGDPGVGRHTIAYNFAALVNAGQVLRPLQYARLIQIDSTAILGMGAGHGNPLDHINLLFMEALGAGNVILIINDIDALLDSSKNEVGRINATEALLPFLKSRLRIIGLTTQAGYQSTIGKNPELQRWFGKIEIKEPSPEETLVILQDHLVAYERQNGLFFTNAALNEIVNLATRLIQQLPNPEKSLEILESTAIHVASNTSSAIVLPEHVQKVVTDRTQIPVEKLGGQEKDLLLNLESVLHERIVGQDEAIVQISNSLRRARSGIQSEKRPIGSFMFLGPTGVGKTETTKALAAVYFGSEQRIIRLDMSEFQELHGITRLIGNADTKEGGLLTEAVMANPFTIILLDEIEKAHPKILNLFLQVLDDGRLTDALGRTASFNNAMIIATSNAGAELIRESISKGNGLDTKKNILDYIQKQEIFRPEFLNRFDGVVVFRPLKPAELIQVAGLLIKDLNSRLENKEVSVTESTELLEYIVKNSYSPEFGARPLRRFIADHVENYIARGLIEGTIKRGQKIEFSAETLKSL